MVDSISKPVIVGLGVGIAFILLFVIVGDNVDSGSEVQIVSDGNSNKDIVPGNFNIVYTYGIGLDYTFAANNTAVGSFTAKTAIQTYKHNMLLSSFRSRS